MKKTLIMSLLLVFGLSFQSQAVSTNSNQGTKAGQTVPQAQGNQGIGNTVQTEEKNKVKNQGENNQIQTQEQNTVRTQDGTNDKANKGSDNKKKGQVTAESHRSTVANFVQSLLAVADREGGIGKEVRIIAQQQNETKEKTTEEIKTVESRSKIKTFFFGSDYKNLGDLRSQMVQTRNQIAQLTRLAGKAENDQDKTELQNQIQILNQEQASIENFITQNEYKFSLFGWAVKLFQ
jgi:hypothetical protein